MDRAASNRGSGVTSTSAVVFAGAGVSSSAGLPLFWQLRDALFAPALDQPWLKRAGHIEGLKTRLDALAPEFAASVVRRNVEGIDEFICKWLALGRPRAEHRVIAEALRTSSVVFTPNFDSLIEEAAALSGHSVRVSSRLRHSDRPDADAQLFKVHGSCPQAVLAATEDVLNPVSTPWAAHFLERCSAADRLVVWGYRGVDPDLAPLVIRGAEAAPETIWIAWSQDDASIARELLRHVGTAVIECVDADRTRSVELAAQAVAVAAPPLDERLPEALPPTQLWFPPHAQASVIAQVGGPSLGRQAWIRCAMRGSVRRSALALGRSVLFDSSHVNGSILRVAAHSRRWASSARAWGLVTLAADGHGATTGQDTWTRRFRPADFDPSSSERDLAITARMITILRRRGRLSGALDVLTHLGSLHDRRGRDRAHRPSWEGRLVHEELALHRRCEDQAAVREVLAIAGEWQSLLVGANWLMWIEDEWAGAALRDGDLDAAESHVRRCRELAAAYGSHPLALGAIEVRALEIEIERLLVTDRERALSDIRQRRLDLALRLKNDPLRALELEGLVAETARISGDRSTARQHYVALTKSPSLLHQLFGAVGMQLCGDPTFEAEAPVLANEIGTCPAVDRCMTLLTNPTRDVRIFMR